MSFNISLVDQVGVVVGNTPGEGAKIFNVFSEYNVELVTFGGYVTSDQTSHLVFIPHNPNQALKALHDRGYKARVKKVILLELSKESNAIVAVTNRLAEQNINITNIYGITGSSDLPMVVLDLSDPEKAVAAIRDLI